MQNLEHEQSLANLALGLMAECRVPPSPHNFELFHAHVAGTNPAISRIIGDMIKNKQDFTADVLEDLRTRTLIEARTSNGLESVGDTMASTINMILGRIEAAGRDAKAYGRTLSLASDELGDDHSPEAMRQIIESLIGATKAMEDRTKSLEGELQRSSHQVSELKAQLDDVRKESLTDPLTGICNRKAFDEELEAAIKSARANDEPMTLFMCDIDHFKKFNDTWGHQTGDQVLRLVAHCLSENVKGRDTAARFGGEEFAVIVRHTTMDQSMRLAEQIRSTVESKKLVKKSTGDILGSITVSLGVAELNLIDTPTTLLARADAALYRAKHRGRNCVTPETDLEAEVRFGT